MGKATQLERSIDLGQVAQYMFSQTTVAVSQAAVALGVIEATADVTEYVIPWEFSVVGISAVSDLAVTAESIIVDATINGAVTGVQATLNLVDTFRDTGIAARGIATGAAGARIGCKITTPAGFTPIAADLVVVVYAILGLEGI